MRTPRTERTADRKSGVAVGVRLPLEAYLRISDRLASRGSNVNQWLRALALASPEAQEQQPITIEEELDRR